MKNLPLFILLILLLSGLIACDPEQEAAGSPPAFDMKQELATLSSEINPAAYLGFYNDQQVPLLRAQIAQTTGDSALIPLHSQYIQQLLYSGEPEAALSALDSLPAGFWASPLLPQTRIPDSLMFRALCYLRIGEQQNCQENHNAHSCIFPLQEPAFHQDPTGATEATRELQVYLQDHPQSSDAIWLLNIAYMTLGTYPDAVPTQYRLDFEHYQPETQVPHFPNRAAELGVDTWGYYGGAVMEDFNGDGLLDLFATSGGLETNVELYFRTAAGGFEQVTDAAGLTGITGGVHAVQADYNNDGHLDLYVIRGGWIMGDAGASHPNSLLKNQGDGTFIDVTESAGLLGYHPTHTACWMDYNLDGHLDLFVGNEDDQPGELFQNKGDGSFSEISEQVGLNVNKWIKGAVWGDYDLDGYPDLFVSSFQAPNDLFRNLGPDEQGNFHFENVSEAAGISGPIASFSAAFLDVNNDGWLDIFCPSYQMSLSGIANPYLGQPAGVESPVLYLNQGDGTFSNQTAAMGIDRSIEAMGLNFGDIDQDGWLDLYTGTGWPGLEGLVPNLLLKNQGGNAFKEVYGAGFGHLQKGHSIAFGDLDNDGDEDVYVSMGGFFSADGFWNALLENPGNDNHWLRLHFSGTTSNRMGVGTQVMVTLNENGQARKIYREVTSGASYGANPLHLHIGIGTAEQIEEIEVYWPASKTRQKFTDVDSDRAYQVTEDQTSLPPMNTPPLPLVGNSTPHHHAH